ncbi:4'-phosphopantetheinyl transferase family protein [Methylocapsa palsarum]|uniref:4'-phosphopantetheinyl transferase n=1 Tax=Methylocapsa palsarum TaxID=1612308 RepID=A0A1I4AFT9_9HYPH|nr:4'-phosphopantetheinyl transferase superfamily protein [Methylocapsa palsarum]SFK55312.1 4'-phosphopantetheinyl transferase [Methylocapsa palsarum]
MEEDLALHDPRSGLRRLGVKDRLFALWRVDLEAFRLDPNVLSADEQDRANRFLRDEDRRRFALTRAALRHLLANATGLTAAKIRFEAGPYGKPYLAESLDVQGGGGRLDFNVSHSGAFALIGIARGRAIGVDIEIMRDTIDELQLARGFFSDEEYRSLASLEGAARLRSFYRIWSCKEAVLKSFGAGITERLRDFSVELTAEGFRLHREAGNLEPGRAALDLAAVRVEPLEAPQRYSAAFALAPL